MTQRLYKRGEEVFPRGNVDLCGVVLDYVVDLNANVLVAWQRGDTIFVTLEANLKPMKRLGALAHSKY